MPRTVRTDRDSHSGSLMAAEDSATCSRNRRFSSAWASSRSMSAAPRSAVAPAVTAAASRRLLAGEDPVETVGQRQRDVDSDVHAEDGGDQVGDRRHAEDGFLVAGVGRDDAGRGRRHHGAGSHARAHGQGQRVEDLPVGHERGQQRDEHGAEKGPEDVHGQDAPVLVRIGAVLFGNHGEGRFPVQGERGPHRRLSHAEQHGQGEGQRDGAQQVAHLLQQQGRPGLDQAGKAGADVERQPGHQEQNGHADQGGRHPLQVQAQGLELLDGDQKAEDEAPDHGEDDDRADAEIDLGLADELDGDGNDEGQRGDRQRQPGTGLV